MPTYTPAVIQELRSASDIVGVISQHVSLKRVGKNLSGLCPFHKEKTPSFYVNPHKQFYKCYGCGEGGDVISFVRKVGGLGFPEAVRQLAQQFHVALPERDDPAAARKATERELLTRVNAWAVSFFEANLRRPGNPGMDYLLSRGLTGESISAFRLGYALDEWDAFLSAASAAGFTSELLERAGLVLPGKEGKGHYDRFRGRVIFPIFDPHGSPIAFGARILGAEKPGEPKYLNSPATPIFSKGSALYGLEKAGATIRHEGRVAVMEGYTDVIRSHQAGVTWAVATLGTALTAEHGRLLKRYTDQVVLVYDADAAGKKAADRGLDVFLQANFLVKVCTLPEGADPCDFFAHAGPDEFASRVSGAEELVDYRLSQARLQGRFATVKEQSDVLGGILATVASIPDPAQGELMVKRISEKTGVTEAALWRRLRGGKDPVPSSAPSRSSPEPQAPPKAGSVIERALLDVLLKDPLVARQDPDPARVARLVLENEALSDPFRAAFLRGISLSAEGPWDPQAYLAALGEDEDAKRLVIEAWDEAAPKGDPRRLWQDCLRRLEKHASDREGLRLRSLLSEEPDAFRQLVENRRREALGLRTAPQAASDVNP